MERNTKGSGKNNREQEDKLVEKEKLQDEYVNSQKYEIQQHYLQLREVTERSITNKIARKK